MNSKKRPVDLVVLSDVHLGTYGCHAKELLKYLKSIKPKTLVLNGDIIDMWQFKKRYFPKAHMKVIKHLLTLSSKGVKTYYITGNHDEMLRKFSNTLIGNLKIVDKLELELDGKKALIFHGDVFDVIMQYSKWLAKLGSVGYDAIIMLNVVVNYVARIFGRKKVSLSKRIKDNVKGALKYIDDFEETASRMALNKGYDFVVCGHIHRPIMRTVTEGDKSILYLNSGDWIENLSALEYHKKKWEIYHFHKDTDAANNGFDADELPSDEDLNNKQLFNKMLADFQSS